MIQIENKMEGITTTRGFWKIWKDDLGLLFFEAPSLNETDDNSLKQIS